jgi:hypothetical protein
MARRKVGVITHEQFGVEVPLYLDTATMEFSAVWERPNEAQRARQRHVEQGPNGDDVRKAMLKFITGALDIAWEPVIEVVILHDHAQGGQIRATAAAAIALRRFWVGRAAIGQMQQADWDIAPENRVACGRPFTIDSERDTILFGRDFKTPFRAKPRYGHEPERVYLAYTDDLWTGLQEVEAGIHRVRGMLESILGTPEGLEKVASIGAAALPLRLMAGGD